MILKYKERKLAIKLRKKGLSYSEILERVPVAKSTLSLWLKSIGLTAAQKQRLTKKKLAAMKRGWETRRKQRLDITEMIKNEARKDIGRISARELWLMGVMLYSAEGSKQKENNVSQNVQFCNSDPEIIKVFIKWLLDICKIDKKNIYFRIHLHENSKKRLSKVQKYWSKVTKFPVKYFQNITWKKNKVHTRRKNIEEKYFGLLSIGVRKSTNLNRKISGWAEGIYNNCGIV